MKSNQLTGFKADDIEVIEFFENGKEILIEEYEKGSLVFLHIHGNGGRLKKETKVIPVRDICNECGKGNYEPPQSPVIISKDEWDRSNIFRCEEFGFTFIDEIFYEVLLNHNVKNFVARPVRVKGSES